jgi:hypothetical protein
MIGNDHVRFGRGPSGKGLASASTSPDGLPRFTTFTAYDTP